MAWMYRVQQRLGITHPEALALLIFCFVFLAGLTYRYLDRQAAPVPEGFYAEEDARFEAMPLAPPADTLSPLPEAPALRINLNTATAAELEQLPRIGPKMAERILEYRAQHGPFRRVEDLIGVRGIGAKTLAQLEPLVAVD